MRGRAQPAGRDRSDRRVRAARFEKQVSLEGFDFTVSAKLPVNTIRDLTTLRFLERNESVVLHDPVWIGESHVAQALGNLACRRNLSVTFLKASRALAHLAGGHADQTWSARLRKLANVDLLILDDIDVRMFTDAQADDLYELITEPAGHPTVYTANSAPANWNPLFPNPVVAESLLDRLVNNSHVLLMDGPSYRPRKSQPACQPTPRRSPLTKDTRVDKSAK